MKGTMTKTLNEAIRARREAIGLSQARLADVAGVSTGTIRNAEAGKPLEMETLEKIERALGWRPRSVEPMLSSGVMAALAEAYLQFSDPRDPEDWDKTRRVFHDLIGELGRGVISGNTFDRARDRLFQYMPGASAGEMADEMNRIMQGNGSVPVVTTSVDRPRSFRRPRQADLAEDSIRFADGDEVLDEMHATVRPETVQAVTHIPGPLAGAALEALSLAGQQPSLLEVKGPAVVRVGGEMGFLLAVIGLPGDVAEELNSKDLSWLAEALQKHGSELARGIAETKRRERDSKEAQAQREEEP